MKLGYLFSFVAIILLVASVPSVSSSTTTQSVGRVAQLTPTHLPGPNPNSTNWSGYVVTPPTGGAFFKVLGSWKVPAVTCAKGESSASSFWVGLDGYTSGTVEQTGTDSNCKHGTPSYFAWYEFFPAPPVDLSKGKGALTVKPGDNVSAYVLCLTPLAMAPPCTSFTVHIEVVSGPDAGGTFTKMGVMPASSGALSSAECIAEAPGIPTVRLANFGSVGFGTANTGVAATCWAVLANPAPCGPLPLPPCMLTFAPFMFFGPIALTMVSTTAIAPRNCAATGFVKASTSALAADGGSFTVTWMCAGP